jgi:hypothetical protein
MPKQEGQKDTTKGLNKRAKKIQPKDLNKRAKKRESNTTKGSKQDGKKAVNVT